MNFLQENKDAIIARAEWMAEQTNDIETLKAYLKGRMDDIKLTERQEVKLKRWQFIYDQLSSGKYTEHEVRLQVMEKFQVGQSISYQDMRNATDIMCTTLNLNKLFKIQVDIQLLDVMKEKARKTNQLDAYARLQKVQTELYKMLPDKEEVPADYFEARQNIIEFNPSLLGIAPIPDAQMGELLSQLKREFNIIDIDHEELENAARTNSL